MTYSIIGRDRDTGEIGAAVQSKFPGVGSIVLHGQAGVGGVTTQAFANPSHGERALELMALGASAEEALAILLRSDDAIGQRQLAILATSGSPAAYTGDEVRSWDGWSGDAKGTDCVASGNTLHGPMVVEAMAQAFEQTQGEIAARLIAALGGGRDAGGELRGQQSAAVLVVKPGGGYGGRTGRHVDISVYDHPQPIEELARCYRMHRLAYFRSDPAKLVAVDDAIARELKSIMRVARFRDLGETPNWGPTEIAAFGRFMGVENYDNRIRDDALVDLEVLGDLRQRYRGGSSSAVRD